MTDRSDWRHLRGKRAVMVVFSYYPRDPRVRRAAESLAREGMCVEVLCLKQNESEPKRETYNAVDIFRVPLKRHRGGKISYVLQYVSFIVLAGIILASRAWKRRVDLVHVHNMPDVLVFSALIPKLLGSKVVLDLHDPMPELMTTIFGFQQESAAVRLLRWLERKSISFSDRVITVNRACKNIFASRSCLPEKIEVIMNAPDEEIFKFRPVDRSNGAARPFVIMYHGSILERNGLDLAVQALALIQPSIPHAELRVFGQSTPFLEQVMNSAQLLGLNGAVRYLGARDLGGIALAIDECDVGIIPNRCSIFTQINTPTRIFEYLSRGKPVIAPAAPGIEDYFDREQLFFFELGDANDLARQLGYVASNPEQVHRVVERGQEVYLAHQWRCERSKLVDLVAGLLGPNVSAS
jgi:glycosyltransferase involved in cell wall biosynthesis